MSPAKLSCQPCHPCFHPWSATGVWGCASPYRLPSPVLGAVRGSKLFRITCLCVNWRHRQRGQSRFPVAKRVTWPVTIKGMRLHFKSCYCHSVCCAHLRSPPLPTIKRRGKLGRRGLLETLVSGPDLPVFKELQNCFVPRRSNAIGNLLMNQPRVWNNLWVWLQPPRAPRVPCSITFSPASTPCWSRDPLHPLGAAPAQTSRGGWHQDNVISEACAP